MPYRLANTHYKRTDDFTCPKLLFYLAFLCGPGGALLLTFSQNKPSEILFSTDPSPIQTEMQMSKYRHTPYLNGCEAITLNTCTSAPIAERDSNSDL